MKITLTALGLLAAGVVGASASLTFTGLGAPTARTGTAPVPVDPSIVDMHITDGPSGGTHTDFDSYSTTGTVNSTDTSISVEASSIFSAALGLLDSSPGSFIGGYDVMFSIATTGNGEVSVDGVSFAPGNPGQTFSLFVPSTGALTTLVVSGSAGVGGSGLISLLSVNAVPETSTVLPLMALLVPAVFRRRRK